MRKTSKEWKKDYKRHKTNKEREPKGGGKSKKKQFPPIFTTQFESILDGMAEGFWGLKLYLDQGSISQLHITITAIKIHL